MECPLRYLIHDDLKHNPLFDGIGVGSVVQVQSILKMVTVQAGNCWPIALGTYRILIEDPGNMERRAKMKRGPWVSFTRKFKTWEKSKAP